MTLFLYEVSDFVLFKILLMAATDFKTLSELIYFGRIQHYGHMKFIANNAIEKYGRDPILVFFRAFAHLLEFNLQEAIQDLESVKNDESVNAATCVVFLWKCNNFEI